MTPELRGRRRTYGPSLWATGPGMNQSKAPTAAAKTAPVTRLETKNITATANNQNSSQNRRDGYQDCGDQHHSFVQKRCRHHQAPRAGQFASQPDSHEPYRQAMQRPSHSFTGTLHSHLQQTLTNFPRKMSCIAACYCGCSVTPMQEGVGLGIV